MNQIKSKIMSLKWVRLFRQTYWGWRVAGMGGLETIIWITMLGEMDETLHDPQYAEARKEKALARKGRMTP